MAAYDPNDADATRARATELARQVLALLSEPADFDSGAAVIACGLAAGTLCCNSAAACRLAGEHVLTRTYHAGLRNKKAAGQVAKQFEAAKQLAIKLACGFWRTRNALSNS